MGRRVAFQGPARQAPLHLELVYRKSAGRRFRLQLLRPEMDRAPKRYPLHPRALRVRAHRQWKIRGTFQRAIQKGGTKSWVSQFAAHAGKFAAGRAIAARAATGFHYRRATTAPNASRRSSRRAVSGATTIKTTCR